MLQRPVAFLLFATEMSCVSKWQQVYLECVFLVNRIYTYRDKLILFMHGYAVHTDLNGVSCRPISRTVREVQLDGLDRMNGRSDRRQIILKSTSYVSFLPPKVRKACVHFASYCSMHLLV